MLEAYFDASEREDGKVLCVAAFAFGEDRARKATGAWKRLWGKTQCHMTDLSASPPRGEFAGWTNEQSKERIEAAVPIINGWSSFGVVVSCNTAELGRLAPAASDAGAKVLLGGFRTPYAVCCHAAMAAMAKLTGNSDIAYFFEYGDKYQGESQDFIGWIAKHPKVARRLYGMRSHAVVDAADCRLFETTDIFAWEWAKFVERDAKGEFLDERGETRMRGSLRALLGDGLRKNRATNQISATRRAWHMTGAPLENYFRTAAELELFSDQPSPEALERQRESVRRVGELS